MSSGETLMRDMSSSHPCLGVQTGGEQLPFPAGVDLSHVAIRFVGRVKEAEAGPVRLRAHVLAGLVIPSEHDQYPYDDAYQQRDELSLHRSLPPSWADAFLAGRESISGAVGGRGDWRQARARWAGPRRGVRALSQALVDHA